MNEVIIVFFVSFCVAGVGLTGLGIAWLFQTIFKKRPLK